MDNSIPGNAEDSEERSASCSGEWVRAWAWTRLASRLSCACADPAPATLRVFSDAERLSRVNGSDGVTRAGRESPMSRPPGCCPWPGWGMPRSILADRGLVVSPMLAPDTEGLVMAAPRREGERLSPGVGGDPPALLVPNWVVPAIGA